MTAISAAPRGEVALHETDGDRGLDVRRERVWLALHDIARLFGGTSR
jgi:hypothetical protein